ncbi:MAG: aldo/keto reductase [Oligoflexia bacterium]|nr:aldo/keto reductase [Oligoflexia bacterium]
MTDTKRTFTLNDGRKIPTVGLGVFKTKPGTTTYEAVKQALKVGYRLIDTAKLYNNETDVGRAVKDSGIPRDQICVTTKLWNDDHGLESALRAAEESNKRLGLEYIDLYLIHWPVPTKRRDSWKALERLKSQGICKSIGVSNYTVRHLNELLEYSTVVPAVNQVEFSPFLYQKELLAFCKSKRIYIQAYSPLTKGAKLQDRRIAELAKKYSKTSAQIILRWALQHEIIVLPKSVTPQRIEENFKVFDFNISEADMLILDGLNEDFRTSWDPTDEA